MGGRGFWEVGVLGEFWGVERFEFIYKFHYMVLG